MVTVAVNNQSYSGDFLRTNTTHFIYTVPQQAERNTPTCTTYQFSVLAVNPAGSSVPSTTIDQTVVTGDDEQAFDGDDMEYYIIIIAY